MTSWLQPKQDALDRVDALLVDAPRSIDLRFERASLLAETGRSEEAKGVYLGILADDPTHFATLINFGALLHDGGFISAARTVYRQVVEYHPYNPAGHVNLGNLLAATDAPDLARTHLEVALRLDPDNREAHRSLSYLLTDLRDEAGAEYHRHKAFTGQALKTLAYYGRGAPIEVLLLVSARGGMIPIAQHFDPGLYRVMLLFVEYHDPDAALPAHHILFNAIGDADLCPDALELAKDLIAGAPVINPPEQVLATTRLNTAARLGAIANVVAPRTVQVRGEDLAGGHIAALGFAFPVLLRAPGFNTGRFFKRIADAQDLAQALADMPGDDFLLIEILKSQSKDGQFRKYRVMIIDGRLYPAHMAVSPDWKVHYFTSAMADNAAYRREEAAFLADMPGVLGKRAMAALAAIAATLKLDYAGVDFGLDARGRLLLYEANAGMVLQKPGADPRFAYRHAAVDAMVKALQDLWVKARLPLTQDVR